MFTGIVQGMANVVSMEKSKEGMELVLDLGAFAKELRPGASVSCAGVCLTVTALDGTRVHFDVLQETLRRTTLGSLIVGESINIERAAKVGDEVGGHLVSGHIMGTAKISRIDQASGDWIVTLEVEKGLMPYLFSKGFVALDGCSLTIVEVGDGSFTVHLIPETLARTTFGLKKQGEYVNLEIDSMTQAVVDTVIRLKGALI